VSTTSYTEATLIEAPAIALFAELGWPTVDANNEWAAGTSSLGRETRSDVVLVGRLRAALRQLNPDASHEAVEQAIEELARDRAALAPAHAAQEAWRLLAHGVRVRARDERGEQRDLTLRVIDWDAPQRNEFLLAAQMTISGDLYTCRPDLLGFVNGLPLVLAELKATHVPAREAYDGNVSHYKAAIPQLFPYVAAIVVSNGSESRVGTSTGAWEHFGEWKRINSEGEQGVVSLETLLRGVCAPARLLDIVENFTLFSDAHGGLARVLGMNHQVLGVNNAFAALQELGENRGRLGVFWHTQGSGKSYSMIFFSQKALRKLGGWTFVIVTDRQELDEQIYRNFASSSVITEQQVQAESGEHLRQLLREDHRHVFTLIQKFHTPPGTPFPVLSERSDIVVITDEAHRSQYDLFALNMRRALPNAAFIGFTGTPLLVGEEKTREVFGDYVSVYNFRQSIEDGATTPLYYENRIPELQLTNADLNADLEALIEAAALDPEQERKLEREFRREYHLITRDDRLETIAEDIVRHFTGRGFPGKAMVVSIDKATAVRMYDKVRRH
jgi:type I restriction enzyme R subunit